jgi:hypothetical protein
MAALTRPWSTGQGEGQICRVQLPVFSAKKGGEHR